MSLYKTRPVAPTKPKIQTQVWYCPKIIRRICRRV